MLTFADTSEAMRYSLDYNLLSTSSNEPRPYTRLGSIDSELGVAIINKMGVRQTILRPYPAKPEDLAQQFRNSRIDGLSLPSFYSLTTF